MQMLNGNVFCCNLNAIYDLKGEFITFRATTQGILAALNQCMEIINQREDYWSKKIESEIERRRKSEDLCKWVTGSSSKNPRYELNWSLDFFTIAENWMMS